MRYDTKNEYEANQARTNLEYLISKQKVLEQKEIRTKRSISQNAYLHVVITLYAVYFGATINEAKTDLKRYCDFMTYQKNGKSYLKETKGMNSKELTEFIDWCRNYASKGGCYIPTSEEYLMNKYSIDKEIEANKTYI